MEDQAPAVTPEAGEQFLYSQIGEPAYKRLTHLVDVPVGGAQVSFQVNRDTEPGWDFLFVESRTAGGDDWTTVADANGHTSQDVGACPFFLDFNPFLQHYLTPIVVNPGDPSTPDDDELSCDPSGTSGTWHAASGTSEGWETWTIPLANGGTAPKQVEVSISYASDGFIQGRGVVLDEIVVSTGQGTTSFEDDGNTLDGWTAPLAAPEGSEPNPNTWIPSSFVPAVPGLGASALVSFDRQPEILAFQASDFGPYPFSASGGVVDDAFVGFALENQTRPTYSPFFFGGPEGNDFVVVHELAHQWYGDSLAVDAWQHIWLNEGFATYAEWLWSEEQGFGTTEEIFDSFAEIPADDEFFWGLAIGDPGPNALFEFPVYARGAMTLEALRQEVGDRDFFRILKAWSSTQAGGNVTTREFIDLAETFTRTDLDPLFEAWLSAGKPEIDTGPGPHRALSVRNLPPAARSLVERLHDRKGQPFKDATGRSR
jgi:hypothetical protein